MEWSLTAKVSDEITLTACVHTCHLFNTQSRDWWTSSWLHILIYWLLLVLTVHFIFTDLSHTLHSTTQLMHCLDYWILNVVSTEVLLFSIKTWWTCSVQLPGQHREDCWSGLPADTSRYTPSPCANDRHHWISIWPRQHYIQVSLLIFMYVVSHWYTFRSWLVLVPK